MVGCLVECGNSWWSVRINEESGREEGRGEEGKEEEEGGKRVAGVGMGREKGMSHYIAGKNAAA